MQTDTRQIPAAYTYLAARILDDARDEGTYFGDRKVFLGTVPSIDLTDPECLATLEDLRRSGALEFARADLVAAMDPALVKASEWTQGSRLVPGYTTQLHFLVMPESHRLGR